MTSAPLAAWSLSRGRFDEAIADLNQEQLNFRLHDKALTIGEMALHVAGVEFWFMSQLHGKSPEGEDARLAKAATDGSVNDKPFPFSTDEITPEFVKERMAFSRAIVAPVIEMIPDALRAIEVLSALGPIITGDGVFARLSFHAGYHHGQVYLIRTAPSFPS